MKTSAVVQAQRPNYCVTSGRSLNLSSFIPSHVKWIIGGGGEVLWDINKKRPLRIWRDEVSALKRNQHFVL